jgi:hypothetical protein
MSTIDQLNARFYRLCAERGIMPPLGPRSGPGEPFAFEVKPGDGYIITEQRMWIACDVCDTPWVREAD